MLKSLKILAVTALFGSLGTTAANATDDIVWQNSNGQVHYWRMRGGVREGARNVDRPVASGWSLKGVGDVDGDGTDDIVWQNSNGQVHYWRMRGGVREGARNVDRPVASGWSLKGVGDVDGI